MLQFIYGKKYKCRGEQNMALIKCPECGEQISNQAKVCIHCGFPLENIKSNKRYSVYITKYLGKNRTEMTRNEVGVRSTLEQLYHIGTYYTDQIKFYPRDGKPMKILDGVSEEYLEYLSADFSYFGCVLDFEESKYIFKIETDGSLKPFDVLTIACDILSEKADNIINFVNEEE